MNAHLRTILDLAKIAAPWALQPVVFVWIVLELFAVITADVPLLPSVVLTLVMAASLTAITTLAQVAAMATVRGVYNLYTTKLAVNKRHTL